MLLFGAIMLLVFIYILVLIVLLAPNTHLQTPGDFDRFLAIFVFLASGCVFMQIVSSLTCRPAQIFYDLRFLSILTTQLTGFVGCLLVAYKLGCIFATKTPRNIVQDKFSFVPFSYSYVINLE